MINKLDVDPKLIAELDALNAEVTAVLAKRKAWMDAHMEDFSEFKVGDEVYDCKTGALLGIVTELYRYWDKQSNPLYDTHMSVHMQYRIVGTANHYDNTSRHAGVGPRFGTKAQALAHLDARRARLSP